VTIEIRDAAPDDADQLIGLIELLPHRVTAPGVSERLKQISAGDLPQLVAVEDGTVIGLCGLHRMMAIHREKPVGRITILVVAEAARGKGIGRQLVEAAEARLKVAGCGMIELTSNDWLVEAHRFYSKIGYEQTSKRFAKQL
jgi:GNAT superfamily N-acetyltransferase